MSLGARLARAEGGLGSALLWREVQKLAAEVEEDPRALYQEGRAFVDRYWHLARPCPDGKLDIEPVLRAMAQGEDLDYEELLREVKRTLRAWKRREPRSRR